MVSTSNRPADAHWWKTSEFRRSLPLFLLALIFFVAGVSLRFAYPTYALYGPGVFTFWALLLALGFTCTIGGVVSWTLASDGTEATSAPAPSAATPAYLPIDFPEPEQSTPAPDVASPVHPRGEFGRPVPDIRPLAASGDWYEGPTERERFAPPRYPLPDTVPPITKNPEVSPEQVEPVEKVLADLERIERELAPRARVVEPSST
jgi:hypothetical protein